MIDKIYSIFSFRDKVGKAPGTPQFVGEVQVARPYFEFCEYDEASCQVSQRFYADENPEIPTSEKKLWINVVGLSDESFIEKFQIHFNINRLFVEDIMHLGQQAKMEIEGSDIFFIARMLDLKDDLLLNEQVSFYLTNKVLITFQEFPDDVFEGVRERIDTANARIRKRGVDYLSYALLDSTIDHYLPVVEQFGIKVEELENKILEDKNERENLEKLFLYKKEISYLRRSVRPIKELVLSLGKSDHELIDSKNKPFFGDLKDNISAVSETIELYSGLLNDLLSLHDSQTTRRLNEIMKVLTIISVIFIPITFIAGIYGTNFEYLPELKYRMAYPVFWMVILLTVVFMLYYFKRKRWL